VKSARTANQLNEAGAKVVSSERKDGDRGSQVSTGGTDEP